MKPEMCKQEENLNLAFSICIQSFMPLIFILLVVHFNFIFLESDNFNLWTNTYNFNVTKFFQNNYLLLFIYFIYIVFLFIGFSTKHKLNKIVKNQPNGGYSVESVSKHEKQSLNYFLTYLFPLLGNTPSNIKDFLAFLLLSIIIVYCVFKENLFFDNIVLTHFFNYLVFDFSCKETKEKCIGITKNTIPTEEQNIRFQRIYKNVYYVEVIKK